MVHNGMEYGIMAAYAEGLNILKHANVGKAGRTAESAEVTPLREPEHYQYDFDLQAVCENWRRGIVIASWLLDLTAEAFLENKELPIETETLKEHGVPDSGEGRWTSLAGGGSKTLLPQPNLLVIFGSDGDLAWRKLLPAIYNLNRDGALPSHFAVVCFGLPSTKEGQSMDPDEYIRKRARDGIDRFS